MTTKTAFSILFFFSLLLLFSSTLYAQQEAVGDSLVSISLQDGSTLKGSIISKDETTTTILTIGGLEIKVPNNLISAIVELRGIVQNGSFLRFDPNYSRLIFGPTGRPLRQGEGYFADYYVFFPSFSYGFTDNFTFMAGMSILPGADLSEQIVYLAPKIGIWAAEDLAFSAGVLYISIFDEGGAGVAFTSATFGEQDKSFTAGLGLGYLKREDGSFEFAEYPIIMLGGNIRVSNSIAFVGESWLILGNNVSMSEQPFAFALRIFGDNLAADVGVILVGEALEDGVVIPWLSIVYNFLEIRVKE